MTPTDAPHRVVLLKGWLSIWSGFDPLAEDLRADGVDAQVIAHTEWSAAAEQLATDHHALQSARLTIIGHSFGADDGIRMAQRLQAGGIDVDMLITLDAVNPPAVPPNVKRAHAFYVSQGWRDALPWWRGVPLNAADANATNIVNTDLRTAPELWRDDLAHHNIDDSEPVRGRIRQLVKHAGAD